MKNSLSRILIITFTVIHWTKDFYRFFFVICSTVDQFSGESSPVILPLNEKEVSVVSRIVSIQKFKLIFVIILSL